VGSCSKVFYPSQWDALHALGRIRVGCAARGRKPPTAAYWCPSCHGWHLTGRSVTQPAPGDRVKRSV
jgi:hypothetical protein